MRNTSRLLRRVYPALWLGTDEQQHILETDKLDNEDTTEYLLDTLLKAFDLKIQEEQGFRSNAEKDSADFHYGDGRVDGVDASRALVEQIFMSFALPQAATKENTVFSTAEQCRIKTAARSTHINNHLKKHSKYFCSQNVQKIKQ